MFHCSLLRIFFSLLSVEIFRQILIQFNLILSNYHFYVFFWTAHFLHFSILPMHLSQYTTKLVSIVLNLASKDIHFYGAYLCQFSFHWMLQLYSEDTVFVTVFFLACCKAKDVKP